MPLFDSSIPWCEKYRPTNLEDIVLDPINRKVFENILKTQKFHNLLFYGPPGVGKTTSANNIVTNYQQLYHRVNRETVIHLNASDDRGIEVIRTQIHQFVKTKNMFEKGYKFVILDEVDYMTKNAQQALKNLLQSSIENVRFILICNYICKIDESLRNEFTCIRFNKLPEEDTIRLIKRIIKSEKIENISDSIIHNIQSMFHSDIRSMINYLQLNQNTIELQKHVLTDEAYGKIHDCLIHNHFEKAEELLYHLSNECNIDIQTLMNRYFNYVIKEHPSLVTPMFLNIVETIIHNTNKEYTNSYFIHHIANSFQQKIKN